MEQTMREIVSDIFTWPWFSEPHGYNFNGHLVRDPGGNVCIDPVEPTEDDLDALVREGVAILRDAKARIKELVETFPD